MAKLDPAFEQAADIHLVETSRRLREIQRKRLAGHNITWVDRSDRLPAKPAIILANEFFDALPVRQFVRIGGGWAERMVGVTGDRLAFGLRPEATFDGQDDSLPVGTLVERPTLSLSIVQDLAVRVARHGGAVLAIDYGHDGGGDGDTLQAVRGHAFDDPLAHPGFADLTVHVDFGLLAKAARSAGAVVARLQTQGEFLLSLGLLERAGRLGAGKDETTQEDIRAAVERLAAPDQMGTLFKVLTVTAPALESLRG